MDYRNLNDEQLIRLIGHKQPAALSELYDRYGRLVFSIAVGAVGDAETAEDLTQEIFLLIWRNASSYKPDKSKVATWLTSITRNRAIDQLRRRKARKFSHQLPWAEVQGSVADSSDLEALVGLKLQQERIRQAMQTLPTEQQQVLALAYFQGYSQSDIARLLDIPLGTVKTRVRLAMQKLRDLLAENEIGKIQ